MKKKFNKKKLAIFVLPILAIGLAMAILVPYLSNKVQADVEVKSPMVVGISEGRESWETAQCWRPEHYSYPGGVQTIVPGAMVDCFPEGVDADNNPIHDWDASDWKETITLDDMYTGQDNTFTLYLMSANVADVEIKGHEEIRVSNPEGITCGDFKPMLCRFDSIYGDNGYGTQHTDCASTPECHNVDADPNLIEIWEADDDSTWGAGETDVSQWRITFNNVKGKYTFTYRVTPLP